jgi:phosphoesterase RecJ-like protein
MELHHGDRLALLYVDDELLAAHGASTDDVEGLVNLPLGARDVVAVAFCKKQEDGSYRISLRSKGDIDVRAVAGRWDGGGHRNAAGCTVRGTLTALKGDLLAAMREAIDAATTTSPVTAP